MPIAASPRLRHGLTLVELALALAIVGTLVAIAVPSYRGYRERTRQATAIAQLRSLAEQIDSWELWQSVYPASLAQIGNADMKDPWGHPYQYLNIQQGGKAVQGKVRKDHNLVPLNSDYDLYSKGPDGQSAPPLTNPVSHDDIIRASDGRYFGPASAY